jgi:hypothetical protein
MELTQAQRERAEAILQQFREWDQDGSFSGAVAAGIAAGEAAERQARLQIAGQLANGQHAGDRRAGNPQN